MPDLHLGKGIAALCVLGAVMIGAVALSAPVALSERGPEPLEPGVWGASAGEVPTVTKKALRTEGGQGYFRVALHPNATDRPRETRLVYWMPQGSTSADAPPELQRTRFFKAVIAADLQRDRNLTFLAPKAFAFSPELDAQGEPLPPAEVTAASDCPDGFFCIYKDNNYMGDGYGFRGVTQWVHLSELSINMNDHVSSAHNRRNKDSKLSEHIDGADKPSGSIHCYDGNSQHPDFNDGFNDKASGLKNTDLFAQC